MSADIAIKVENLSKEFDKGRNHGDHLMRLLLGRGRARREAVFQVFSGIDFSVRKGEAVGILGVNGAGKSTLLQVIAGVMQPTTGTVECQGRVSALLELGAGFNPEFTGRENVYLNAAILGLTDREIDAKLPSILAFADLDAEFIDMPVKTYSSGMYVRLAFAVAIHVDPDILIVDEALAVGDIFFQQKCFAYLNSAMRGVTKLFVTHDLNALATLAERVLVLDRHRLVFDGDPKEAIRIYQGEAHRKTLFKGRPDTAPDATPETGPGAAAERLPEPTRTAFQFDPITENLLTGVLDIAFDGIAVYVQGEKTDLVGPDQDTIIALRLANTRGRGGRFVIGFFFRDRTNQMVLGQNTLADPGRTVDVPPGASIATIEFAWPDLRPGEYTLTVGIGEIDPAMPLGPGGNPLQEIKCWANNVRVLTCANRDHTGCLLAADNVRFSISAG